MDTTWDVIVVGGGAAGLSAALMLGRARRRVLVVDQRRPRNRFATHMHGVLGNEGAQPSDYLARGRAEASGYGVQFVDDAVERVDDAEHGLDVLLRGGEVLHARAVVVASGASDRLPDIPGLAQRWGRTVLHCPYCHGWEVRDKRLGVLTMSAMGLHQAEMVRQWSDDLVVFAAGLGAHHGAERRLEARGIRLVESPVVSIEGDGTTIDAVVTRDGQRIAVDALFTQSALEPHEDFLAHLGLDRADTPMGNFLAADATGRTSHPRIWAAGNVTNPGANVPISVGAGATAGAMANAALIAEDFDVALAHGRS